MRGMGVLEMQRVLVDFEAAYDESGVAPGDVFRAAEVVSREDPSDDIGSRAARRRAAGVHPGQGRAPDHGRRRRSAAPVLPVGVPGDGVLLP